MIMDSAIAWFKTMELLLEWCTETKHVNNPIYYINWRITLKVTFFIFQNNNLLCIQKYFLKKYKLLTITNWHFQTLV